MTLHSTLWLGPILGDQILNLRERIQSNLASSVDELLTPRRRVDQASHLRLILALREIQPVQRRRHDVTGDGPRLRDLAER